MRLDNKGDIGFPEAIMAVMIVTIVLTAYLGAFVLNTQNDDKSEIKADDKLISSFHIENDTVVGMAENEMIKFIERNGYCGAMIRCSVPGDLVKNDIVYHVGPMDGDIIYKKYLKTLNSDDGTAIPVIFEVLICF